MDREHARWVNDVLTVSITVLQALRFPDDAEMRLHIQEQLWGSSPQMVQYEAEKYAHRGRIDWDDDLILRENLLSVLTLKVSQHQELLELLEETGDRELQRVGPVSGKPLSRVTSGSALNHH